MTVIQLYEESYPKDSLGKTFPALSTDTVPDLTILDILCDKSDFFLSLLKSILPLNIVILNYAYTPSFLIIFLTFLLSAFFRHS